MKDELQIRTPEGIAFALPLAGPLTRCLAWVVDMVVIVIVIYAFSIAMAFLSVFSPESAQALLPLIVFFVQMGYSMTTEWFWRGQTLGKRIFRLRVMDVHGLKLQPSQVVLRNLLRAVDFLPAFYLLGGATCLLNRRLQRMGDLAANTVVVSLPRVEQPDIEQLVSGHFNSLREHVHLAARLRQKTTPEEAALVVTALLRRDQLEPRARVELFGQIAAHFKAKVEFPPESVESVGDEQYLRNLVDVLYNARNARSTAPVFKSPPVVTPAASPAEPPPRLTPSS